MFAAGNGGRLFQDCYAYNGYVNNIHTIAVTGINRDGSIPGYGERCGGIMAVAFRRETFMEKKNPVVGYRQLIYLAKVIYRILNNSVRFQVVW